MVPPVTKFRLRLQCMFNILGEVNLRKHEHDIGLEQNHSSLGILKMGCVSKSGSRALCRYFNVETVGVVACNIAMDLFFPIDKPRIRYEILVEGGLAQKSLPLPGYICHNSHFKDFASSYVPLSISTDPMIS